MKNYKNIIIKFGGVCLAALFMLQVFSVSRVVAQEQPPIYMFIAEIEGFLEKSEQLVADAPGLSDDEIKVRIEELMVLSSRASRVYFANIDSDIKPELDRYLHDRLQTSQDIRHFFVLMGNEFLNTARAVLNARQADEKRIRSYSTIGGTVVGLGSGTALLLFAKNLTKNPWVAGLVVVGLGVAGGVAGHYASPLVAEWMLPADPAIKNADDFLRRYPAGEDFISELENLSPDLSAHLQGIEELMSGE